MNKVLICCLLMLATLVANAGPAYEWDAALTLESISNLDGGIQEGTRQLSNLDATLTVNTDAAGGWSDGKLFVYVLGNHANNPSEFTGDMQGISNIATYDDLKVYEFWYEHRFEGDRIKILVGLHDYNSTFYSLESAGLFTHPSFGIGPDTSQVGPSIFSTTATAVHLTLQGENQYLLAAIYDGIPGDPHHIRGTHITFNRDDGLFSAAEWGWYEKNNFKIALGAWQHTAKVENPINGELSDDNAGLYFIAEKSVTDIVAVFVQIGHADKKWNQLENYYGTGVTLNSFWREGDGLGLAVAHARNGQPYLLANPELDTAETAWEFTYFLPLVEHINVQTSLYYIQQPAMDKSIDDALAAGARMYIQF